MGFTLQFTREAAEALAVLGNDAHLAKKLAKVRRALGRLESDPGYPSLRSHKYTSLAGANGEDVWDSYVENDTPSAWRIFWHYGPGAGVITVVSITPHPN